MLEKFVSFTKNKAVWFAAPFALILLVGLYANNTRASDTVVESEEPPVTSIMVVDESTASVITVDENNQVTGYGIVEWVKDKYEYISVRSKEIKDTWIDSNTEVQEGVGNSEPTSTEN